MVCVCGNMPYGTRHPLLHGTRHALLCSVRHEFGTNVNSTWPDFDTQLFYETNSILGSLAITRSTDSKICGLGIFGWSLILEIIEIGNFLELESRRFPRTIKIEKLLGNK